MGECLYRNCRETPRKNSLFCSRNCARYYSREHYGYRSVPDGGLCVAEVEHWFRTHPGMWFSVRNVSDQISEGYGELATVKRRIQKLYKQGFLQRKEYGMPRAYIYRYEEE